MKFKDIRRRTERFAKQIFGKDVWTYPEVTTELFFAGKEHYVVCSKYLSPKSIIYSAGIGDDISFDLDIIKTFGASVYGFDPSPVSIAWVEKYNLPVEFRFFPYGISDHDGTMFLYPPENPKSTSFSLVDYANTSAKAFEVPVRRVLSVMKELGHSHIDLLKLDIEGGEYMVIDDMIRTDIKPGQIVVEFHHRFSEIGISKTKYALRLLKSNGYKIVYVDPRGYVYSFIQQGLVLMQKPDFVVAHSGL
ncbi:MAG TPA: FkbM family methyltransferase [bacterium]|nr:FkbM family methyltransferase [bacterium]